MTGTALALTPPPVPADADLRPLPFMPLHVAKLRDSDLAAECEPEACWYAVLLWCAAWHQLPAGSLPNSDKVLCKLIGLGRDLKTWNAHREQAMRGWYEASDGRLYHPTIAAEVNKAWRGRLEQAWRTECARIRKANQRNKTEDPLPSLDAFLAGRAPATSVALSQGTLDFVPEDTAKRDEECPKGQGDLSHGKTHPRERDRERERDSKKVKPSNGSATREREDLLAVTSRVAAAAGVSVIQPSKLARAMDVVKSWQGDGVNIDDTALPVIAKRLADMPADETVSSLAYFDAAVRKAHSLNDNARPQRSEPPPPLNVEDDEDDRIPIIRRRLSESLGERTYTAWLGPNAAALALNGSALKVTTPSTTTAEWVRSHFSTALAKAAKVSDVNVEAQP